MAAAGEGRVRQVRGECRMLETHPLFPHKANIEFITIPDVVTMCGSGADVCLWLAELVQRSSPISSQTS